MMIITAEARADLTCLHCRYYNCVHGYPHIYDCPPPLIFDEAQGTCVREEQASSFARKCETAVVKVRNNPPGRGNTRLALIAIIVRLLN